MPVVLPNSLAAVLALTFLALVLQLVQRNAILVLPSSASCDGSGGGGGGAGVGVGGEASAAATATTTTTSKGERRGPRLADGCLHVFLDVGANIGVHTRFLFEPEKYPNRDGRVDAVFDGAFGQLGGKGGGGGNAGRRDNRDICSFGFEPNPKHWERHRQLEESYRKVGWRYTAIQAGASDTDSNMTFYHHSDRANEEWGFSAQRNEVTDVPEIVPLVRLSRWIRHNVVERRMPSKVHGRYGGAPPVGKVVMKMDVEGSEYVVLPDLLFSGVFCDGIDVMFGEYHERHSRLVSRAAMEPATGQGRIDFQDENNQQDARLWAHYLLDRALKGVSPSNCRGRWMELDDESYLHDGVPLPG